MSWLNTLHPEGVMPPCKLKGDAKAVFDFLRMLATTYPIKEAWWVVMSWN